MKFKAAIYAEEGKPLIVDEVEVGDPGPGEVRVKIFASGICHSQLHSYHKPKMPMPNLMGHEATGVVMAKGKEVTHLREGDHVMVTWLPRDADESWPDKKPVDAGAGVRWRGDTSFMARDGIYTWSEVTQVHHQFVVHLPGEFPTDVTSFVGCAVMTGAGAVLNTAKVQQGQSVAVFGVGGVGISALNAAAVLGADPIIAVDIDDAKLDFARKFGATHGINASSVDPVDAIQKITNGGVDYAFDAIGAHNTQLQIAQATRPGIFGVHDGGTAILMGLPKKEVSINLWKLVDRARIYRTSIGGSCRPDRDFPIFLDWFKRGLLKLDEMVTRRYSLDQANDALEDLEKGRILGRSIIEF